MQIALQELPITLLLLLAAGFGVIIGSFLNVLIYRFHTGKSLTGSSHCLSCGSRLRWFELFPLVSYMVLRGRCRQCGCSIPSRYFWVELITGGLFAATLVTTLNPAWILFWWFVLSILVVIAVYDLRHYIIPDVLTISISGALLIRLIILYGTGVPLTILLIDVGAALAGVTFFFSLWFVSRGRWLGFGDVKLAFPLGLIVGAASVFSMIVLSFWVGAVVSLCLIAFTKLGRGKLWLRFGAPRLTIKSVVPFAPFMIIACLLVFFTHFNVLALFTL